MSMHFSANQYEQSFRAPQLGNWEVSKWYPHVRPRARRGHTKIIADDRGHLLPGVPRVAPWGHFKSTWQLPRRITKKLAKELSSSGLLGKKDQTPWEKRSSHHPLIEQEQAHTYPLPPPIKKEKRVHSGKKEIPIVDEQEPTQNKEEYRVTTAESLREGEEKDPLEVNRYQPYDRKDEHDYSLPVGYDGTTKVVNTAQRVREDIESYSKTCRSPSQTKTPLEALIASSKKQEVGSDHGSVRSEGKQSAKSGSGRSKSSSSSKKSRPLGADFVSAQYAKDLAQNNLKHRPLPDVIDDRLFQALQIQQDKHPGTALDNMPSAAAVGHKTYRSPGPTQCSKLKVYRPKTAPKKMLEPVEPERTDGVKSKDVGEIDLAICWDLTPPRPGDEPKRPVHIDGSNGSVAPGIFTVVKPREHEVPDSRLHSPGRAKGGGRPVPRAAWPEESKPVNPSAVMDIINNNLDEFVKPLVESPKDKHKRHSISDKMKHNGKNHLVPINGSKENNNPNTPPQPTRKNSVGNESKKCSHKGTLDSSSVDSEKLEKQRHYRSSPDLTTCGVENSGKNKDKMFFSRPCMACETRTPLDFALRRPKSEYKMAFKAGVPNSHSNANSDTSNRPHTAKPLSVPKPKTPFAKKNYAINTLAPPFSLWPGTMGMDYPEHWRLSSVYQQSFKPIELRKNPMIKGIFR